MADLPKGQSITPTFSKQESSLPGGDKFGVGASLITPFKHLPQPGSGCVGCATGCACAGGNPPITPPDMGTCTGCGASNVTKVK